MQDQMRDLYASVDIDVVFASVETLNVPATLQTVDVGGCNSGSETAEQTQLFSNRNFAGINDICVYFVTATNPPYNGCAAYANLPSAVVASTASGWTLAHEVGHILGLPHIDLGAACDFDKLMTGCGTWNVTNPPPDITPAEVATMYASALTT
jgi:hypothetical protein